MVGCEKIFDSIEKQLNNFINVVEIYTTRKIALNLDQLKIQLLLIDFFQADTFFDFL